MAKTTITLGDNPRVTRLFSYPNLPDSDESLQQTVLHWIGQSLERDQLKGQGADAAIRVEGTQMLLDLEGPEPLTDALERFAGRLAQLLQDGEAALNTVIPQLKREGRWDPDHTGQWRFFLPLGLPLINQRSIQFFHYPPIRLLDPMRDYLDDPVPVRWEGLLEANGVAGRDEARLYETVVDATPIAAPDDQGSSKSPNGDPEWGLMPIQYFPDYQRALVRLLLNPSTDHPGYTVPLVVCGSHPRQIFSELFLEGRKLGINGTDVAEILPGLKTPVVGTNHPYRFYAQGQIDKENPERGQVGSGRILPEKCAGVTEVMRDDLAAARWQMAMAEDPSPPPEEVMEACKAYWRAREQRAELCAMVRHQGSLFYPERDSLQYRFNLSLDEARTQCREAGDDPCAGDATN